GWAGGGQTAGPAGNAEAGELGGNGRRRAGSVVGDERHPHAARLRLGQRVRRPGNGRAADVDDPVEVEQRHVVGAGKRLGGGAWRRGRRITGHGRPDQWGASPAGGGEDGGADPARARSVARTPRSASV